MSTHLMRQWLLMKGAINPGPRLFVHSFIYPSIHPSIHPSREKCSRQMDSIFIDPAVRRIFYMGKDKDVPYKWMRSKEERQRWNLSVKQRPALKGSCKPHPEVCPLGKRKRCRQGSAYVNSSVCFENTLNVLGTYLELYTYSLCFSDPEVARQG